MAQKNRLYYTYDELSSIRSLELSIPWEQFKRLKELGIQNDTPLQVTLQITLDSYRSIILSINDELSCYLSCDFCDNNYLYKTHLTSRMVLLKEGSTLEKYYLTKKETVQFVDRQIKLPSLLEDDLLLALPIYLNKLCDQPECLKKLAQYQPSESN